LIKWNGSYAQLKTVLMDWGNWKKISRITCAHDIKKFVKNHSLYLEQIFFNEHFDMQWILFKTFVGFKKEVPKLLYGSKKLGKFQHIDRVWSISSTSSISYWSIAKKSSYITFQPFWKISSGSPESNVWVFEVLTINVLHLNNIERVSIFLTF
jgi:hypothetical protein